MGVNKSRKKANSRISTQNVLGLTGMQLVFFTSIHMVLFRLVTKMHQGFPYCWTVLACVQAVCSSLHSSAIGLGVSKNLGVDTLGQLTKTDQRYPMPCNIMLRNQMCICISKENCCLGAGWTLAWGNSSSLTKVSFTWPISFLAFCSLNTLLHSKGEWRVVVYKWLGGDLA